MMDGQINQVDPEQALQEKDTKGNLFYTRKLLQPEYNLSLKPAWLPEIPCESEDEFTQQNNSGKKSH